MQPSKIWANLGVENIERTQEFYSRLGFKQNGQATKNLVSYLLSEDEFVIHFFEKDQLKKSLEGEISDLSEGNEVMFTLSAENKDEFDSWVKEIHEAGGTVFFDSNKDKKEFYDENGYHVCVFADPDGHKFNLFYNANR